MEMSTAARLDGPELSPSSTPVSSPDPVPAAKGGLAPTRHFGKAPVPVDVTVAGRSHVGKLRATNEDHFAVVRRSRAREVLSTNLPLTLLPNAEQASYVMAVADGMGGAAFGEIASTLAIHFGWSLGFDEVKWTFKIDRDELRDLEDKLKVVLEKIDARLIARMREEPRTMGMGTTLTAAYTVGLEAVIGHVGDSRAYLIRDGQARRLTRDHTLAQDLADYGVIDQDEVDAHRLSHVLTNCLGGPMPGVTPDVFHVRLMSGDHLLLCSDGLTNGVKDEELAAAVETASSVDHAAEALEALALDRGGRDNITIVLTRFDRLSRSVNDAPVS
jgi:protein phosphatase